MKRDTLKTILANGSPAFRAANSPRRGDARTSTTNVEPDTEHVVAREDGRKAARQRYRIAIHSHRVKLCDPDGISCKAAIDGLVQGGALVDDSLEYVVCSPVVYQHKVDHYADEKTVIVLDRED